MNSQARKKFRIVLVAGARPNFMKIAPIVRELEKFSSELEWRLVHTGQHYDRDMSDVFFDELGIPKPHFHMGSGGGTHAQQTARIMIAFEDYCSEYRPDLVVVVGDVDSTVACTLVAKKLRVAVAHVEAGLRSHDMNMPEEINRIVTDSISDLFFVTEQSGLDNLMREGHQISAVHFVGHVMIDNLFFQMQKLSKWDVESFSTNRLKSSLSKFGIVTLHRPANVDNPAILSSILTALNEISDQLDLIFPIHPRTRRRLDEMKFNLSRSIHVVDPLSYMEFLNLWTAARVVITDSGGLQEETTALSIPCITLRENTERPITVTMGSNVLVGHDADRIRSAFQSLQNKPTLSGERRPPLWDGRSAERIVRTIIDFAHSRVAGKAH